ncbi:MAG: hypothetical protein JNK87_39955 [Bryobacterales bacterium]|nr:hypothetical protein [Bryobacterales bacterium]
MPSTTTRPDCSPNWWLIAAAALSVGFLVCRAALQAITIDEATTFELWVLPATPAYWDGASNNHILNSVLIKLFTSVFGLSHLTMRAAACLGGALFYAGICYLAHLLTPHRGLQWIFFVFAGSNPLILDYLVAARGYSLAMAFLVWLFLIPARLRQRRGDHVSAQFRSVLLSSLAAGLCIAANFSFAIMAVVSLLLTMWWTHRRGRDGANRWRHWGVTLLAGAGPAALVLVLFAGHAVTHWPAGQLWWGATSTRTMLQTVAEASLYQPNPYVLNPLLLRAVLFLRPLVLPVLCGSLFARVLVWIRERRTSPVTDWREEFGTVLLGSLAITVFLHWILFRLAQVLLPQERTALYIPVVLALFGSVIASIQASSRAGDLTRKGLIAALAITSVYFLTCVRLSHFKEWEWGAEVQRAYAVVAAQAKRHSPAKVASSWHYATALNFYRQMYGDPFFETVSNGPPYPANCTIYVVHSAFDKGVIESQKLRIVYSGPLTEMVVAVLPETTTAK